MWNGPRRNMAIQEHKQHVIKIKVKLIEEIKKHIFHYYTSLYEYWMKVSI
jgi:hypothetical protein